MQMADVNKTDQAGEVGREYFLWGAEIFSAQIFLSISVCFVFCSPDSFERRHLLAVLHQ
jgi:hypothetical protein